MTDYGYYRVDTAHLYHDHGKIRIRKGQIEAHIKYFKVLQANIKDEDPTDMGEAATNGGVKFHSRPILVNLIKQDIQYDNAPLAPTNPTKTDMLYIRNLSHLSTDPSVIGRIVSAIIKRSSFDLFVISVLMNSADSANDYFFDGLINWSNLPTRHFNFNSAPSELTPSPKFDEASSGIFGRLKSIFGGPRHRTPGVHILGDGGGDGGGNGGC